MEDFTKYERLCEDGNIASDVWRQAQDDGLDFGARIRMVRKVFGLTLIEAKAVSVKADTGRTLAEHQQILAQVLEDLPEFGEV